MRALDRKLFRDILHLRGQVIAVALVVACGVSMLITMWSAYQMLLRSQQSYYASHRFAQVFAHARRAPESLTSSIRTIPGVAGVRTRIVVDVTLDIPGLEEPATGRLISIPEHRRPMMNDILMRRGRWIDPERDDEVIVSEIFANANELDPGHSVGAVINGTWRDLKVVGIGLSPEYVYEIRPTDLFPDSKRFGVMWMSREALEAAWDMEGAFNDVTLSLAPGADVDEVIASLDRILERWGGTGAYDREDQISHRFLSDEIAGDRVSGTVMPTIFLAVAAFLIHIVLTRLVQTQRDQIAILKAFGYTNFDVGLHFVELALVVVLIGTAIGVPTGIWLARKLAEMYTQFFNLPVLEVGYDPVLISTGIGVSALAAMVGAIGAVRKGVTLPPAEAMRPEAPPTFRPGVIESLGLFRYLHSSGRIIIRNLARRRGKAFFSILGLALAVAILVVGRFMFDAIDWMMEVQFHRAQRQDVSVMFNEPKSTSVLHDLGNLPGVMRVEQFRGVPVRFRHEHRSKRGSIQGMSPEADLRKLVDEQGKISTIPPRGLVLNRKLAEILGVEVGDLLEVEVLEGNRPHEKIPVVRIVDELMGIAAYMSSDALADLLLESKNVSGAWLAVDSLEEDHLNQILKRTPAVGGVSLRRTALESFQKTIAESLSISTFMIVFFACVIAVGMVYNSARIALSERGRELASLRVLGFTRNEVAVMLFGEQAILTLVAIPVGFAIGYALSGVIAHFYDSEIYRIPLVISAKTWSFTFLVILASALFSGALIYRRIRRLDLVEVLKTRE